MQINLCFPRPGIAMGMGHCPQPADEVPPEKRIPIGGTRDNTINSHHVLRFRLEQTTAHPASHYGCGVLLDSQGEILDGFMFRLLRDRAGAWIETDDPEGVMNSLGVQPGEPGIKEIE